MTATPISRNHGSRRARALEPERLSPVRRLRRTWISGAVLHVGSFSCARAFRSLKANAISARITTMVVMGMRSSIPKRSIDWRRVPSRTKSQSPSRGTSSTRSNEAVGTVLVIAQRSAQPRPRRHVISTVIFGPPSSPVKVLSGCQATQAASVGWPLEHPINVGSTA
jgi:hypothetical protein